MINQGKQMKTIAVIVCLSGLLFAGCSRKSAEEMFDKGLDAQKSGQFNNAITFYQDLINTYPDSARTPEAYYAVGSIYQNQKKDFYRAIDMYRQLIKKYPQHATSSNAAFLIGFMYNNDLKQYDSARIAYGEFIREYPTDHLVGDAQFELSTLGKTPEEILKAQTELAQESEQSQKKSRKK